MGAILDEAFLELINNYPQIEFLMRQQCTRYRDHWKSFQINILSKVEYLEQIPYSVREDIHYRLSLENYEPGAKVFNRGTECRQIIIVVNGLLELSVE